MTIKDLIKGADREDLEVRALAAFQLNADLVGIIRILVDENSTGAQRNRAREQGRSFMKAFDSVQPVAETTTQEQE
jgi:hypothetical protein